MIEMSLFRFGFTATNYSTANETEVSATPPSYMPQQSESGLGSDEYANVTTVVSDLANPEPAAKKRKTRGQYTKYSDADRAKIGRYASENGIERARRHFLGDFSHLTESTVRN